MESPGGSFPSNLLSLRAEGVGAQVPHWPLRKTVGIQLATWGPAPLLLETHPGVVSGLSIIPPPRPGRTRSTSSAAETAVRTSSGCEGWCPSVNTASRRSCCTKRSASRGWRRTFAAKVPGESTSRAWAKQSPVAERRKGPGSRGKLGARGGRRATLLGPGCPESAEGGPLARLQPAPSTSWPCCALQVLACGGLGPKVIRSKLLRTREVSDGESLPVLVPPRGPVQDCCFQAASALLCSAVPQSCLPLGSLLWRGGPPCPPGRFHPCCFSAGCVLLYKQDFTKNLGLCCITCTYCSQTCQRAVTEQLEGSTWDFCSEDCKSKYLLWYFKVGSSGPVG